MSAEREWPAVLRMMENPRVRQPRSGGPEWVGRVEAEARLDKLEHQIERARELLETMPSSHYLPSSLQGRYHELLDEVHGILSESETEEADGV